MADDWYSHPVAARFCTAVCANTCTFWVDIPGLTEWLYTLFGEQVPVYGKFR